MFYIFIIYLLYIEAIVDEGFYLIIERKLNINRVKKNLKIDSFSPKYFFFFEFFRSQRVAYRKEGVGGDLTIGISTRMIAQRFYG